MSALSSIFSMSIPFLLIVTPIVAIRWFVRSLEYEKLDDMNHNQLQLEMMKLQAQYAKCRTSHLLHFFLCFPTFGIWLLVWPLVTLSNNFEARRIEDLMSRATQSAGSNSSDGYTEDVAA